MSDALLVRGRHDNFLTAAAAVAAGECWQLADGRAAIKTGLNAGAANDRVNFTTTGKHTMTKTASQVFLPGQRLYWDHSANAVRGVPPMGASADDRDFYVGVCVGGAASAATTCLVDLNVEQQNIIDMHRDGGDTAVVLTAGTPTIQSRGGSLSAAFSATAEAQKLDWLSKRSFPLSSNWILEAIVEVVTTCDADVGDLSVGVANATHASDADSITESAFFHFDLGADTNIDCESDDGTTEVAATDSTIDFAAGTPVHLMLDGRDPSDVKFYINCVEVLNGTANLGNIAAAAGPLKALFHLEKSSDDSPGEVSLDDLRVRLMEQDTNT